jgi:hypothetical protein
MDNSTQKGGIKENLFYIFFVLLVIGSVGTTFLKYVVFKNYQIFADSSCNPQTEKCFVSICDPAEDSTCPENEADRVIYYKLISKNASEIYKCEQSVDKIDCNGELTCKQNEKNCSYTYCDPANLGEGEQCAN